MPSSGALPSRRLAARLLERAAREAARRCAQGDSAILEIFTHPNVDSAWRRLLADREPLVWRHVASGPRPASRVERGTGHRDPPPTSTRTMTPRYARRGAASLAASIAMRPEQDLARSLTLLRGEVVRKDAGVCGAIVLGIPRAAEVEPKAAEQLLEATVERGGLVTIRSPQ